MTNSFETATETWPIEFRYLGDIRDFVKKFAEKLDFNSVELAGIQLAVNEAISNIMEHGSNSGKGNEIRMTVEIKGEALTIVIEDNGKTYDPTRHAVPEKMVGHHKRGRGIFLMKKIMDRLEYQSGEGQPNRLMMVKRASTKASA